LASITYQQLEIAISTRQISLYSFALALHIQGA